MNFDSALRKTVDKKDDPFSLEGLIHGAEGALKQIMDGRADLEYVLRKLANQYPDVDVSKYKEALGEAKKPKQFQFKDVFAEIFRDGRPRTDKQLIAESLQHPSAGKTENKSRRPSDVKRSIKPCLKARTLVRNKDGTLMATPKMYKKEEE